MRVSVELYDQIVSALRSDKSGDKDKRREPRVGLTGEANLITVGADGKRLAGTVRIRDVSPGGIGLFFNQPLEKGQRFVLQLEAMNGDRLWLVCHAAHTKKIEGGRFLVGARVAQVMRADQIKQVEAQTAASSRRVARAESPVDLADVARLSKAILG